MYIVLRDDSRILIPGDFLSLLSTLLPTLLSTMRVMNVSELVFLCKIKNTTIRFYNQKKSTIFFIHLIY